MFSQRYNAHPLVPDNGQGQNVITWIQYLFLDIQKACLPKAGLKQPHHGRAWSMNLCGDRSTCLGLYQCNIGTPDRFFYRDELFTPRC
jgi:hypothetical protein